MFQNFPYSLMTHVPTLSFDIATIDTQTGDLLTSDLITESVVPEPGSVLGTLAGIGGSRFVTETPDEQAAIRS